MSSIRKRGTKYQVRIKYNGREFGHTCDTIEAAEAWAKQKTALSYVHFF